MARCCLGLGPHLGTDEYIIAPHIRAAWQLCKASMLSSFELVFDIGKGHSMALSLTLTSCSHVALGDVNADVIASVTQPGETHAAWFHQDAG